MSGFAPIDLINQVRIRPGIYNKEALIPPRWEHRQQLWLEVAESLTPAEDWSSFTVEEKEMRMSEVSKRWTNLRDHFYREVKLLEAGEGNKKRKYIYFNDMEFVRPYIGYKKAPIKKRQRKAIDSSNNHRESEGNDTDIDMSEFLKAKNKSLDEQNEHKPKKMIVKTCSGTKNTQKTRLDNPSSSSVIGSRSQNAVVIENFDFLMKSDSTKNPTFKIRESDISFCLSLVPTLQKMSEVRKLSAKIDILKVLQTNMAQIERNESDAINRHDKSKGHNQDEDIDELVEQCEEEANIKTDPLNGSGNNKAWWC